MNHPNGLALLRSKERQRGGQGGILINQKPDEANPNDLWQHKPMITAGIHLPIL